jgi:hypothetical protein
MIAWKLLKQRKDGSLGPLFINKKQRIPFGIWLMAENHPTKGFAVRPGWHCCSEKTAPHLSKNGRVWAKVEIDDYQEVKRPKSQGGLWFLANQMRLLELE